MVEFQSRNRPCIRTVFVVMTRAALILVGPLLVAGCQSSHVSSPTPPGPSGQVIPWLPLTPDLPPPSPSPGPQAIPENTVACQAQDLAAGVTGSNGAIGHLLTSFGFFGVTGPCYLDGTPPIELLDSTGQAIDIRQHSPFFPPQQPGRALIEPGPVPLPHTDLIPGQVSVSIDWVTQPEACPGAGAVVPARALIAIPAGGVLSVAIPPEPAAYACQGLGVSAFEGPYVPVQVSTPPLPAISMQVPADVRAGEALVYLVTLSNNGSLPAGFMTVCPTYEEELVGDAGHGTVLVGGTKHIYGLNCAPLGTLKPGAAATFQMVFSVPPDAAPGKYMLMFGLGYWNAMSSFSQAPVTISR
jgi:hypothetical protein